MKSKLLSYHDMCPSDLIIDDEVYDSPPVILSDRDIDSLFFFKDYLDFKEDEELSPDEREAIAEFVFVSLALIHLN